VGGRVAGRGGEGGRLVVWGRGRYDECLFVFGLN